MKLECVPTFLPRTIQEQDNIFASRNIIERVIRSKRRTISLEITPDAQLVIRAPRNTPLPYLQEIVNSRRLWIQRKKELCLQRRIPLAQFLPGESFPFLGKHYRLDIVGDGQVIRLEEGNLQLPLRNQAYAKDEITLWYRAKAREIIPARVKWFCAIMAARPASLKISNARHNLGSCGPKDSLNFSWRLVKAGIEIIDYVVVHELSHLEVRNHSRRFWDKVARVLPDYKSANAWLKKNTSLLNAF